MQGQLKKGRARNHLQEASFNSKKPTPMTKETRGEVFKGSGGVLAITGEKVGIKKILTHTVITIEAKVSCMGVFQRNKK